MKTYWLAEFDKCLIWGPSGYVGTLIVENDGEEPDWAELGSLVFGIGPSMSLDIRNPIRKTIHLDDPILSQSPRLLCDAYKVWVIHPTGSKPNSGVVEDESD